MKVEHYIQVMIWKHILMNWEVLLTVGYISSEVIHKLISLSIHIHHRDDKVVRVRIEVEKVDNNRESAFSKKQVQKVYLSKYLDQYSGP